MSITGYMINRQDNCITVVIDGKVYNFPYQKSIIDLINSKNAEALLNLKSPKTVLKSIFGDIINNNDTFYLEGTNIPLPSNFVSVILKNYQENLNIDSLIKFWKKAIKCPNKEVVESLFDFLEKNNMPITEEGNVIGFKRVKTKTKENLEVPKEFVGINFYAGKVWKDDEEVDEKLESDYLTWLYNVSKIDLVDCHSGTYLNNVGTTVRFKGTPDYDRKVACSAGGLHVANEEYARNFYFGNDKVLIMVEFSPEHVISCPYDNDFAKLRVMEYKVLSIVPE